ncbi:MAG: hypothetical protein WCW46_02425 [Candidatus Paceibacterota bacterium]|jgi:hypothetical protein
MAVASVNHLLAKAPRFVSLIARDNPRPYLVSSLNVEAQLGNSLPPSIGTQTLAIEIFCQVPDLGVEIDQDHIVPQIGEPFTDL